MIVIIYVLRHFLMFYFDHEGEPGYFVLPPTLSMYLEVLLDKLCDYDMSYDSLS